MRRNCSLLAICAALGLSAQQTNVLFIGNSYTYVNDLPNTFRQLALSLGDTVNVASSAPGGYTFQGHSVYAPTLTAIASQAWDFVVLQEQSQIPSFPQSQVEVECYPYAAQLVNSIRTHDACTEPVFYMTWGRQNGDADNCAVWPPVCTYEGMQAQLRESYLNMAQANSATCAPAGATWQHVREQYPMLNLYAGDGSHPSPAGTYVVASTMYATMFRQSPVGASVLGGLAADTAGFIQQIAASTVLDSLTAWNIGVNDPNSMFAFGPLPDACLYQFDPIITGGTHLWDFGDGTTSTQITPQHDFAAGPGSTVTHTITDACGRTSSTSITLPACSVGLEEQHDPAPRVIINGHHLLFQGIAANSTLEVFDAAARLLISGKNLHEVTIPDEAQLIHWRVINTSGIVHTGRILVP